MRKAFQAAGVNQHTESACWPPRSRVHVQNSDAAKKTMLKSPFCISKDQTEWLHAQETV